MVEIRNNAILQVAIQERDERIADLEAQVNSEVMKPSFEVMKPQ